MPKQIGEQGQITVSRELPPPDYRLRPSSAIVAMVYLTSICIHWTSTAGDSSANGRPSIGSVRVVLIAVSARGVGGQGVDGA